MDGGLIAGDAGGFLNSMRLKGIHLAMRTGMLAAETAFEAVRAGDTSAASAEARTRTGSTPARSRRSSIPCATSTRHSATDSSPALRSPGLSVVTKGWLPEDLHGHPGHERMKTLAWYYGSTQFASQAASNATTIDRRLTFDKVTNVHYSGTSHDEDQPPHLLVHTDVCSSICGPEYGHPCMRFCPANVYEIVARRRRHAASADQRVELRALQDVRHHGSVPGDHLGAARGRRRTAIQWHVNQPRQREDLEGHEAIPVQNVFVSYACFVIFVVNG